MLLLPFTTQTYVWCTIIVRWKYVSYRHRTLRVANPSINKSVRDTYDWQSNVRLFNVSLSITSNGFYGTVRAATGATSDKTLGTHTITKHVRPVVVTEALGFNLLSIRPHSLLTYTHILVKSYLHTNNELN